MVEDSTNESGNIPPKKFLNDPNEAVDELINGLLLQYPNQLQKLQNHNVLLSSDIDFERVNVLSGGGSGHEPSHAGWISKYGMLTGAILGGIFASPSVSSILAAIRAVNLNKNGVLLIVKNYTGDVLNFGMACERANSEGFPTKMLVVADDKALLADKGITGARGVAGTVFFHKILGTAASRGMSLDDLMELGKSLQPKIGTMGVALDSVTIPGATTMNNRLDYKTMELGLGIHGEAGTRPSPVLTADDIAPLLIQPISPPSGDLVVMINNLGGTSNFELSILTQSIVKTLESSSKNKVCRLYVGSYMTSFDMRGASLTIFSNATAQELELLDEDTDALSWTKADVWQSTSAEEQRPSFTEVPEVPAPSVKDIYEDLPCMDSMMQEQLALYITNACLEVIKEEPTLTQYDVIVGDGDCGITLKRGATEILNRISNDTLNFHHVSPLMASLADAISSSMGGTSGILMELMFRKMSTALKTSTSVEMAQAFVIGVEAVSEYGGATLGCRTMLDALIPAATTYLETNDLALAASAAEDGAQLTATMATASAGRSNYLHSDTLQGTPDPGAHAAALILTSLSNTYSTLQNS